MKKSTRILMILVAMLLVASLAFAACKPTVPAHTCRHLCSTCDKCTDKDCSDSVCAEKCKGHGSTSDDDDKHECESKCKTCYGCLNADCKEDACSTKCKGHDQNVDDGTDPKPVAPDITAAFNGAIYHNGASGTVGEMVLYSDGTGSITIKNPNASFTGNFVDTPITYTLANGVFTIWTAPDSNIKTPAKGTVQGRTVSVTVTNGMLEDSTSYEFTSKLSKVTVENMLGNNETNTFYYPEGYQADMSATRSGYTLEKVLVNNVERTTSWLRNFTVPAEDVTLKYFWKLVEQTGNYTVIYQSGDNGMNESYTDHATSNLYTLISLYGTEDDPSPLNFTVPQGKFFAGWLVNGTTKVSNRASITLTEETTVLVAQWGSNITVTLKGLHWSGVESNLKTLGWEGNYVEGFTQQFTSSANFFMPAESAQWNSVIQVSRSGYILTGWECSQHENEVHAPEYKHALAEDVTFTAVWQRDTGTSSFDGTYTATTPLDLSDWGFGPYVSATISGRKLTLYDADGVAKTVNLGTGTTTVTGTDNSFWTYTLTLEGNTLTISATRGSVGSPIVGVFTRAS